MVRIVKKKSSKSTASEPATTESAPVPEAAPAVEAGAGEAGAAGETAATPVRKVRRVKKKTSRSTTPEPAAEAEAASGAGGGAPPPAAEAADDAAPEDPAAGLKGKAKKQFTILTDVRRNREEVEELLAQLPEIHKAQRDQIKARHEEELRTFEENYKAYFNSLKTVSKLEDNVVKNFDVKPKRSTSGPSNKPLKYLSKEMSKLLGLKACRQEQLLTLIHDFIDRNGLRKDKVILRKKGLEKVFTDADVSGRDVLNTDIMKLQARHLTTKVEGDDLEALTEAANTATDAAKARKAEREAAAREARKAERAAARAAAAEAAAATA